MFMLLEDEHGTINLILPARVGALPPRGAHRPLVLATGRLERLEGTTNVVVDQIVRLERPDLPRAEIRHIEPRRTWSSEAGEGWAKGSRRWPQAGRIRLRGADLARSPRRPRLRPPRGGAGPQRPGSVSSGDHVPGHRAARRRRTVHRHRTRQDVTMGGRILVGTSSWADPGFVKDWYPPKMPAKERLPWYSQRFEAVELNSSFYAIPDRNTVHGWVESTPDGFIFDVKVHRALSRHAAPLESLPPDLREEAATTARGRVHLTPELEQTIAARLVEETAPLAEAGKLGSYLLQLTPAFAPGKHHLEELDTLVETFAPHRLAIELRHRGWVREKRREETLAWFSERGAAFVCVDAPPGTTCRSCRQTWTR